MALDEIIFQGQCFHLVANDDELKIRDFRQQVIELEIVVARLLKVRADAVAQRFRLADVDNPTIGVFIEVDSRLNRNVCKFFLQRFNGRHDVIMPHAGSQKFISGSADTSSAAAFRQLRRLPAIEFAKSFSSSFPPSQE